MNVWVICINHGYEGYSAPNGVFSSKEVAEKYISDLKDDYKKREMINIDQYKERNKKYYNELLESLHGRIVYFSDPYEILEYVIDNPDGV